MMNKIVKKLMLVMFALMFLCTFGMSANANPTEEEEGQPLAFQIEHFSYEILPDASQEDMPAGFTLTDWEYNGVSVKAGKTENSDMVCVMAKDVDSNSEYRFIYDSGHELFVPYFGTEIKNGYIYTIPMYEGKEVPYGFVEAFFVFQTVPMNTYMREDAELTQEEIAAGILAEDNYLVLLMMDEEGNEVHYTYDLIDRTFQRSLLQLKDAEQVTELNGIIDDLHEEIGKLNANHTERMNKRLTLIGILLATVFILIGVLVNLIIKVVSLKKGDDEDDEEEEFEEEEKLPKEEKNISRVKIDFEPENEEDDLEILDLDLED